MTDHFRVDWLESETTKENSRFKQRNSRNIATQESAMVPV